MTSSNVKITKTLNATGSQVVLTIDTTNIEKTFTKVLSAITFPQTSQNRSSGLNDTKIMDLLRIERRYNIDGHISYGNYNNTDTNTTASSRGTDLENFFIDGGVMTFNIDGEQFTGNIEKLSINYVPNDGQTEIADEIRYNIKFTILRGVDL